MCEIRLESSVGSVLVEKYIGRIEKLLNHSHPNLLPSLEAFFHVDPTLTQTLVLVREPFLFGLEGAFVDLLEEEGDSFSYPVIPEPFIAFLLREVCPLHSFTHSLPFGRSRGRSQSSGRERTLIGEGNR